MIPILFASLEVLLVMGDFLRAVVDFIVGIPQAIWTTALTILGSALAAFITGHFTVKGVKMAQKEASHERYREWAWTRGHEALTEMSQTHLEAMKIVGGLSYDAFHSRKPSNDEIENMTDYLAKFISRSQNCLLLSNNPKVLGLIEKLAKLSREQTIDVIGALKEKPKDKEAFETTFNVRNDAMAECWSELTNLLQGNFRALLVDPTEAAPAPAPPSATPKSVDRDDDTKDVQ